MRTTSESLTSIHQVIREEVDHVFASLKQLEPKPRPWLHVLVFSAGIIGGIVIALAWGAKGSTDKAFGSIGIPMLVEQVRSELIESERERTRKGQPPLFEVKSVDIEVAFVVRIPAKPISIPGGSRSGFRGVDDRHRSEATLACFMMRE